MWHEHSELTPPQFAPLCTKGCGSWLVHEKIYFRNLTQSIWASNLSKICEIWMGMAKYIAAEHKNPWGAWTCCYDPAHLGEEWQLCGCSCSWPAEPFPYWTQDLAHNTRGEHLMSSVSFSAKSEVDITDHFEKHVFQWANVDPGPWEPKKKFWWAEAGISPSTKPGYINLLLFCCFDWSPILLLAILYPSWSSFSSHFQPTQHSPTLPLHLCSPPTLPCQPPNSAPSYDPAPLFPAFSSYSLNRTKFGFEGRTYTISS